MNRTRFQIPIVVQIPTVVQVQQYTKSQWQKTIRHKIAEQPNKVDPGSNA